MDSIKKKIETQEQFNEFVDVEIPCAYFHVMPTDIDDKTGARLEDIILLDILTAHPELLKFKRLDWFVKRFITDQKWD